MNTNDILTNWILTLKNAANKIAIVPESNV